MVKDGVISTRLVEYSRAPAHHPLRGVPPAAFGQIASMLPAVCARRSITLLNGRWWTPTPGASAIWFSLFSRCAETDDAKLSAKSGHGSRGATTIIALRLNRDAYDGVAVVPNSLEIHLDSEPIFGRFATDADARLEVVPEVTSFSRCINRHDFKAL